MRDFLAFAVGVSVLTIACGHADAPPPSGSPPASATLEQRVADFIEGTYVHGVPYDEARTLGAAAVPILVGLIKTQPADRSNILTVLGMLGGSDAELALKDFVRSGSGNLADEEVELRLDALTALGYAANVATTDATLNYLIGGLQPATWPDLPTWRLPSGGDPSAQLRQRSIAALGLSGKTEALSALQVLLNPPPGGAGGGGGGGGRGGGRGGGPPLTPSEISLLRSAIETNQFIASHAPNGLSEYYKKRLGGR